MGGFFFADGSQAVHQLGEFFFGDVGEDDGQGSEVFDGANVLTGEGLDDSFQAVIGDGGLGCLAPVMEGVIVREEEADVVGRDQSKFSVGFSLQDEFLQVV